MRTRSFGSVMGKLRGCSRAGFWSVSILILVLGSRMILLNSILLCAGSSSWTTMTTNTYNIKNSKTRTKIYNRQKTNPNKNHIIFKRRWKDRHQISNSSKYNKNRKWKDNENDDI